MGPSANKARVSTTIAINSGKNPGGVLSQESDAEITGMKEQSTKALLKMVVDRVTAILENSTGKDSEMEDVLTELLIMLSSSLSFSAARVIVLDGVTKSRSHFRFSYQTSRKPFGSFPYICNHGRPFDRVVTQ